MDYAKFAAKLVEVINSRRKQMGLNDDHVGKLLMFTTDEKFEEWIRSDPDNSADIALGAHCALFEHSIVNKLPEGLEDSERLNLDNGEVGFFVDILDDEVWKRK